ncbi:MAG: FAD:protein FMN transferase [Candidatus Gracilibacteria bacterium]|nr:FAD:protein FMN transferase [Candidatus Gracilibacteria bacterium]
MKYSRNLFGSRLDITINSKNIDEELIETCFLQAQNFENKYSRFIKGNYLYNLNKKKSSQIDGELFSIINLCKKVSDLTDGYFDITIIPFLENIGYGIEDIFIDENIGYKNIEIKDDIIYLKNEVSIDLGSVGKGYIIDKIYTILDKKYDNFIINFGGDIRVKGKHIIYLEDPLNDKNIVGEIELQDCFIASSSPNKRKTKKGHHLINPFEKNSQNDKIAIFLTHKLSSFSDIFSTALFVTPLEKSLNILSSIKGLEGLIIDSNGNIYKSSNLNCNLYKKG